MSTLNLFVSKIVAFTLLTIILSACNDSISDDSPFFDDSIFYTSYCGKRVQSQAPGAGQDGKISYSLTGGVSRSVVNKKVKIERASTQYYIQAYDELGNDPLILKFALPGNVSRPGVMGSFDIDPFVSAQLYGAKIAAIGFSSPLSQWNSHDFECSLVAGKITCAPNIDNLNGSCSFSITQLDYKEGDLYAPAAWIVSGLFSCSLARKNSNWPSQDDTVSQANLTGSFSDICIPHMSIGIYH